MNMPESRSLTECFLCLEVEHGNLLAYSTFQNHSLVSTQPILQFRKSSFSQCKVPVHFADGLCMPHRGEGSEDLSDLFLGEFLSHQSFNLDKA